MMGMEDVEQNIEVLYEFVRKRPEIMKAELEKSFGIRTE